MYYRFTQAFIERAIFKPRTSWIKISHAEFWTDPALTKWYYTGNIFIKDVEPSEAQWAQRHGFRILGQIARAKANIRDIRNSEFVNNMLKDRLYDAELHLDEAETQARKAINSPRKK